MHLAESAAVVGEVVADMRKTKEPVPEPIASRRFSGKFLVRVPPDVHRELATDAAEAGVSLNRLVSFKLAMPAGAAPIRRAAGGKTARGR